MSSRGPHPGNDSPSTESLGRVPSILDTEETHALVEELATFFERFGFRRNLGRLWATLYLSPRSLAQPELCDHLGISAGLISSGLKELDAWQMIVTVTMPGERRAYYRAETHMLRVVGSILSRRKVPAVKALRGAARRARQALAKRGDAAPVLDRLRAIEDAARLYSALARVVMQVGRLPAGALAGAVRLIEVLRFGGGEDDVDDGDDEGSEVDGRLVSSGAAATRRASAG